MNLMTGLGIFCLAFGALLYIFALAVLGSPPLDIGLTSTVVVFLLFGGFGLWLGKTQQANAA